MNIRSGLVGLFGGTALRSPTLRALYLAVFLGELGASAAFPLRLLYAQAHHATPAELGLMASVFFLAPLVVQLPLGWLIDHWGRVPVLMLGVVGHLVIGISYIVLNSPVEQIILRFLEGMTLAAIIPAVNAYIADSTPIENRSEAYGVLSATTNGGLLLGPLAGGIIGQYFGFAAAYVISALFDALSAALIWGRISEPARHESHHEQPAGGSWRDLVSGPLLGIYGAFFAGQIVMGTLSALWTIWVRDLGGSYTYIGITFTVFALPQILLGAYAGRKGDLWGRASLLIGPGIVIGVIYASYGVVTNLALILLLGIVEGVALVFQQPVLLSLLSDASPIHARGRAQGLAGMAGATGGAGAALVSIPLYHAIRPAPFLLAGLVVIAGSLLAALSAMALARGRQARPTEEAAA